MANTSSCDRCRMIRSARSVAVSRVASATRRHFARGRAPTRRLQKRAGVDADRCVRARGPRGKRDRGERGRVAPTLGGRSRSRRQSRRGDRRLSTDSRSRLGPAPQAVRSAHPHRCSRSRQLDRGACLAGGRHTRVPLPPHSASALDRRLLASCPRASCRRRRRDRRPSPRGPCPRAWRRARTPSGSRRQPAVTATRAGASPSRRGRRTPPRSGRAARAGRSDHAGAPGRSARARRRLLASPAGAR